MHQVSIHEFKSTKFKFFCAKFHQIVNTYPNWPSQDSLMLKKSLPYLDLFLGGSFNFQLSYFEITKFGYIFLW
jgi:hypothetical protein